MPVITRAVERARSLHRLPRIATVFAALLALLSAVPGCASDADVENEKQKLRDHLESAYPDLSIDSMRTTPLDGIYEVVSGTRVLYVSADGRYFIRGSLIDLESERDLTEARRAELIHDAVDAMGEQRMLIFEPENGPAEHTITVFTDTSCPYCQRLHEDLLTMQERHPIRVRYLLFPRAGVEAGAADTMRDVWCAPDPQAALTAAKRGESVASRDQACETPIAQHYELGQRVGVKGTPFLLVGDDGPAVPGYRRPRQLLSMLGISS